MYCVPPQITTRRRPDASSIVGVAVVTAPTETAVSVDQAKKQVELPAEDTSHDDHLGRLIAAATTFLEGQTGRQFCQATYDFSYDQFPPGREPLWIPRPPLQSITSVKYLDSAAALQTMPTADYTVAADCLPGRVSLKSLGSGTWPVALWQGRCVTVRAVCGFATSALVPADIQQALLFLVDEWFNRRSGIGSVGPFLQALIDSLRLGDDFLSYAPVAGDPMPLGSYAY